MAEANHLLCENQLFQQRFGLFKGNCPFTQSSRDEPKQSKSEKMTESQEAVSRKGNQQTNQLEVQIMKEDSGIF